MGVSPAGAAGALEDSAASWLMLLLLLLLESELRRDRLGTARLFGLGAGPRLGFTEGLRLR